MRKKKSSPSKPCIEVRGLSVEFDTAMVFEEGTRIEIVVMAIVKKEPDVMVKSMQILPALSLKEV